MWDFSRLPHLPFSVSEPIFQLFYRFISTHPFHSVFWRQDLGRPLWPPAWGFPFYACRSIPSSWARSRFSSSVILSHGIGPVSPVVPWDFRESRPLGSTSRDFQRLPSPRRYPTTPSSSFFS